MIFHKCDRCGKESQIHEIAFYEFCDECYQKFIDFVNMRDFTPEGVRNVLVERGQREFRLGEEIKYSPLEVEEILNDKRKSD